jgi:hypothetical protein
MSKQTDLINIPDAITVSGSNVGIGTTSPAQKLHIEDTSASVRQRFVTSTSNQVSIDFGDTDSGSVGRIQYDHHTDALSFNTNSTERIRILSSGGITFNGDTAAANALDDYEYGSWTPTTPNAGSATPSNAVYTKIGDQVTVWCLIQTFTDRSTATSLTVKGLPFNATNTGVAVGTCMCQYVANTVHTIYMSGSSGLQFYKSQNGSGFVVLNHSDLQNSAAQIYLMATYTAA